MITQARGFGLDLIRKAGMGGFRGFRGIGQGLSGNGTIPGPPYCDTFGSYADESSYFGFEDCSPYANAGDVGGSAACAQRNLVPQANLANFQIGCSYSPNYAQVLAGNSSGQIGENLPSSGNTYGIAPTSPTAPSTSPNSSGGVMQFYNTTTGDNKNFKVGDSFQINISGAKPNSLVSTASVYNGSSFSGNQGNTDGSGNFTITGTMDTSVIGNWTETWTVGGVSISGGVISFNVSATSIPSQSTSNPTPSTPTPVSPTVSSVPSSTYPNSSTNTTNTTNTGSTDSFMNDFVVGLENVFNFGNWGTIFASGDLASILGLATPLVVGGFLVLGMFKGRR